MRLARVADDGEVWLGRLRGDELELFHRESDHPAADATREVLGRDGRDAEVFDAPVQRVVPLAEALLLAPVSRPSKILAVGLNYADHAREANLEVPSEPVVFAKAPSSIVGPGEIVSWPTSASGQVDYESELAVVIGRRAAGDLADPMAHVLGFTVANDVTARDAQFRDGQWVRSKSFDTFCPVGPIIVTTDEIADCQALRIGCRVNGVDVQASTTAEMFFGVAELVRYLARCMTLEPGDLVLTGTPAGVGFARTPPTFLGDGDTVACWIEGIGELVNTFKVG